MAVPAATPTPELLSDFFAALRPRIQGELRSEAMTRALYATDASMYQIMPHGVLFPRHAEDVQEALRLAARFSVPVLARGGGSSLAGQTVAEALVIDFSRHMNGLLELNPDEGWARVEPGLVLDNLNEAAARHGLQFGPDPASSNRATLGGMLANNATGTHSILYGNTIHHVREARGFLADGTPFHFRPLTPFEWDHQRLQTDRTGRLYADLHDLLEAQGYVVARDTPRHWRRNSGYRLEHLLPGGPPGNASDVQDFSLFDAPHGDDGAPAGQERRNLARLLCGSEGTLAVVTEMTVGLVPLPKHTGLGMAHFRTRAEALRAVTTVLKTGPSAVELFDGVAIDRCRRTPGFAERLTFIEEAPSGEAPGGVLLTEYYGETEAEVAEKIAHLEETLERARAGYAVVRATKPRPIQDVWTVRKESLGLIMGVKSEFKPWAFIEDASVPVEHLADYVDALDDLIQETGTRAVFYAHASGGCLHVRPFINTKEKEGVEKMKRIARGSMELVRRYGGSLSSEHGDGTARSWLSGPFLGPDLVAVYARVKEIFDPENLLNPGKITSAPPMEENLRMGPAYETLPVTAKMDFSEDGGFHAAIEMCNGNGACRKLGSGTMCPSYMVTRDEEHSTRGRANALRTALSGALPPEALTSKRMFEVMDLCIQCKACKTECPSSVDMGKIKTEWLDKYWQEHRMPWRTKLFAHLPKISRRVAGGFFARPANWLSGTGPVRRLMDRTLGISRERALPPFARESFEQWFKKHEWKQAGPEVVLFADTFSNFHAPEAVKAAAAFLDGIGMQVQLPQQTVCCGRTLLSKGLVSEAQVEALGTVAALYPYAAQNVPIVGLEPSCVSALTDEFRALLPGDPRVEQVAKNALTFEGFVARLDEAGLLGDVRWTLDERTVLLHGHCHEKALGGTGAAERALALPPGYRVETVDSGCCGMAGAFGYETEHLEISKKMAERRLAPAVRAASPRAIIAAAGFSCRSQIKDTTARAARHPAEILWEALA